MPKRKQDQDGLYRRKDSPNWWASYTDRSGRRTRRSTGTANRKEAEALLSQWRLDTHRGKHWGEEPTRTFDDLMLTYLKATEQDKRAPWRDRQALKHLYPIFTGKALDRITPVDVRGYIAQRRAEEAAASTINKEVGLISVAYRYAKREWGWNYSNPAERCRQREPEGRVRWLSRAEAPALIQAAEGIVKSPHLADLIRLAINTGMRRGELLGLEWRRVDLQAGLIHLEAEHTKTAARRSIPINRAARAALMGRLRFRAEHCPGTAWVFSNRGGKRIGDIKNGWATACQLAGIEDFHFHDLRHTCASWLIQAGVPMTEVGRLLGHSTLQTTERYCHITADHLRDAVSVLDGNVSRNGHAGNGEVKKAL